MKKIFILGISSLCLLAFFSCNKEENPGLGNDSEIYISFEAGPLEMDPDTKVHVGDLSSSKYPLSWEAGDKISIIFHNAAGSAGQSSNTHVANRSSRYFTTVSGDGKFSGMLDLDELSVLGGTKNEGTLPSDLACFMVYPATNLTVSAESIADPSNPNFFYYEVTGAEIAEVQDGTGWPYCYFTSLYGQFARSWKGFTGTRNFVLNNTLLRFKVVNSSEEIINIKIETDTPQFVGPVTFWLGINNSTEFAITGGNPYQLFKDGGNVKVLNIRKEDNSALPADIWFACCSSLDSGNALNFTFTSKDGKACSISATVRQWMKSRCVYNLGELDLQNAVWE